MALLGATGHTYAVALSIRLQAQSSVPATADMYAFCASLCVSQQIVHVAPYDSAKGFVFAEGSATNSVHSIHYHRCLQTMLCQIRNSTYITTVSSLRTLTRLAFVPAALVVPSSLKSEGGVLMHS